MLYLVLNNAQCQCFPFLTLPLQGIDWRVQMRLGGDMVRQLIPAKQRESVLYIIMLNSRGNTGGSGIAIFCLGTVCTLVYPWEVENDCFCITCFIFFVSSLFHLINSVFFPSSFKTGLTSSHFCSSFPLHPTRGGGGSEQADVWYFAAYWG